MPASDENDLRKSYSAVLDLNKAERQQRIDEAVQQVFAGRRRQPVKFLRRPSGIEVCSGQHNEVLPDPVEYFRDLRSRFPPPSLIAITHGDLNASNILVDAQGHPWLIDFFRTGWGHALRDAAELESVTKFELLDHGESLMNILAFEAALIKSPSLNHIRIPGQLSGIFNRPLAVLREVRKQAASVSGDPEAMMEYRAALFLYAIKELSRHPTSDDPALLYSRRAHVLYSAALIARFLQY
ncbi:MAG: phosphotransferase [Chloroflexi bacterium]|nr:phosphotransferase [Chloroflexota bacterium]